MAADPTDRSESLAAAITEVSERMTVLVREEVELAKAEMTVKATSLARGAAAIAIGVVFGVFALIFVLLTIAWAINDATGDNWLGFFVVTVLLIWLTVAAVLFARRKLGVGPPTPQMAIDEARKITATVREGTGT